jgi:putative Holliday junction resolvase
MSIVRNPRRRVAALDLGKARVGLAISDDLGMLAHPRPALDGTSLKSLLETLRELVETEAVGRFLVGLPKDMSGSDGTAAQRAVRFCRKLADTTGCEVELVDERLTTVEATRRLREQGKRTADVKASVDSASAAILLQQWLDRRGLRRPVR